ncbi:DUF1385 domain-containing protein [Candidatus Woesearchaeota archaeon]|nr:DUF1385 domain-containing protein [Candidatus Woesearchaeota archaeon]
MKKVIGGQAVIEGVMMKSDSKLAISVRKPDGKIKTTSRSLNPIGSRIKLLSKPFVRGTVVLFETLVLGLEALSWSAREADEDEKPLSKLAMALTIVISFLLAIGLFIVLPLYLTKFIVESRGFLFNLMDGLIRLVVFLGYLLIISMMKDVKRVFEYHGAEHMAVHCYEEGKPLNVQNVRKYTTLHGRCGTAFVIIVLVFSILVFSLITSPNILVKLVGRIILIPVIAGVSYEILKFTDRFKKNKIVWLIMQPGLFIQKITTKQPVDKQIEVAIEALKAAK